MRRTACRALFSTAVDAAAAARCALEVRRRRRLATPPASSPPVCCSSGTAVESEAAPMSREEVAAAMRNLQLSLDGLQRELEGATAQTHMRVPHRHCMQLLRQALAYLKQGCPAASIRGAGRGLHLHDRQTVELPIPPPPPPPPPAWEPGNPPTHRHSTCTRVPSACCPTLHGGSTCCQGPCT